MTSAQVRLGVTPMGATVAVKRIPKIKVRSLVALRNLANEVNAMRALTDARAAAAAAGGGGGDGGETAEAAIVRGGLAHVARLRDVRISNGYVYMIQEAGGCDLYQLMGDAARATPLSSLVVCRVARGLSAALAAVHAHGWCHRDIKPENVLLGGDVRALSALAQHTPELAAERVHVRLCDFGIATRLPREGEPGLAQFCGTPGFFAPELVADAAEDARDDAEDALAERRRGQSASADARPDGRVHTPPVAPRTPRGGGAGGGRRSPPSNARAARAAPAAPGATAVRRGYDGRAADVWSVGATLLEPLLGRAAFNRLWMGAYTGFDRQGRAQLRGGVRSARSAVLAHAALLYDDAPAAAARLAAATVVVAPVARGPASAARGEPVAAAAEPQTAVAQPRAAEPEGLDDREAARRRALARELTTLVLRCLDTSVALRVSSAALAEGVAAAASAAAAAPEGAPWAAARDAAGARNGVGVERFERAAPAAQRGALFSAPTAVTREPVHEAMPPLDTAASQRAERQAYADTDTPWPPHDEPRMPFTVAPEAAGFERLAERGQERKVADSPRGGAPATPTPTGGGTVSALPDV